MNGALISLWRVELAAALQSGEITIAEGVAAMRAIDRLENEGEQTPELIKTVPFLVERAA